MGSDTAMVCLRNTIDDQDKLFTGSQPLPRFGILIAMTCCQVLIHISHVFYSGNFAGVVNTQSLSLTGV
jgi:hypothetical protein